MKKKYLLLQVLPGGSFSQVCVTYNRGYYTVYVDGLYEDGFPSPNMPINSQTESFIGMNVEYGGFDGYIDDVSVSCDYYRFIRFWHDPTPP